MTTQNYKRWSSAFTLIELLIVVAIIAILAAIAVPNFLEAQTRAKVARSKADVKTMVTAMASFHVDNNKYISGEYMTNFKANPIVYNGSLSELWRLTTPISYMTSIPQETPFGPWKQTFYGPTKTFEGYLYIGGAHWSKDGLATLWCETWGLLPPENVKSEYFIYCVGPSKLFSSGQGTPAWIKPYDPTNGTVSVGDILYVEGPQKAGWTSFK